MAKRTNHVIMLKSGWAVKKSGSVKSSKLFSTKEEAKKYGIDLSRKEKTELYVHRKDGTIQNRNSY